MLSVVTAGPFCPDEDETHCGPNITVLPSTPISVLDAATAHKRRCVRQDSNSSRASSASLVFIDNEGDNPVPEQLYGVKTATGARPRMEDVAVAKLNIPVPSSHDPFDSTSVNYFAVYDGHGGAHVAEHCAQTIHLTFADILSSSGIRNSIQDALSTAFMEANDSLDAATCQLVGSTAAAAVVGTSTIWTAHCGDSRVVMSRNGLAVALTADHIPERTDEATRIIEAGGTVVWRGGYRVQGALSMTRAIGDLALQKFGVTPMPELSKHDRQPEDNFMLLATDGLWGVMSNQEAVDLAAYTLQRVQAAGLARGSACRIASAVLARMAFRKGSQDNVSVIFVDLQGGVTGSGKPPGSEAPILHRVSEFGKMGSSLYQVSLELREAEKSGSPGASAEGMDVDGQDVSAGGEVGHNMTRQDIEGRGALLQGLRSSSLSPLGASGGDIGLPPRVPSGLKPAGGRRLLRSISEGSGRRLMEVDLGDSVDVCSAEEEEGALLSSARQLEQMLQRHKLERQSPRGVQGGEGQSTEISGATSAEVGGQGGCAARELEKIMQHHRGEQGGHEGPVSSSSSCVRAEQVSLGGGLRPECGPFSPEFTEFTSNSSSLTTNDRIHIHMDPIKEIPSGCEDALDMQLSADAGTGSGTQLVSHSSDRMDTSEEAASSSGTGTRAGTRAGTEGTENGTHPDSQHASHVHPNCSSMHTDPDSPAAAAVAIGQACLNSLSGMQSNPGTPSASGGPQLHVQPGTQAGTGGDTATATATGAPLTSSRNSPRAEPSSPAPETPSAPHSSSSRALRRVTSFPRDDDTRAAPYKSRRPSSSRLSQQRPDTDKDALAEAEASAQVKLAQCLTAAQAEQVLRTRAAGAQHPATPTTPISPITFQSTHQGGNGTQDGGPWMPAHQRSVSADNLPTSAWNFPGSHLSVLTKPTPHQQLLSREFRRSVSWGNSSLPPIPAPPQSYEPSFASHHHDHQQYSPHLPQMHPPSQFEPSSEAVRALEARLAQLRASSGASTPQPNPSPNPSPDPSLQQSGSHHGAGLPPPIITNLQLDNIAGATIGSSPKARVIQGVQEVPAVQAVQAFLRRSMSHPRASLSELSNCSSPKALAACQ